MARLFTITLLAVCMCGLIGCAGTSRVDANTEVFVTHDFNPKDLQLISEGTVDEILKKRIFNGQARPKLYVAKVLNLTDEHINTEAARDYIVYRFSNSERVDLLGRDVVNAEARKELERQQGAFMDPSTASKIGKHIGARFFAQGRLTNIQVSEGSKKIQYFLFTLRIVDVETLRIEVAQKQIQKVTKRGWFGW
jgi:penicillin-binding protein activator